jgi:hypothetical protein
MSSDRRFSDSWDQAAQAMSTTQNVLIRLLDGYTGQAHVLGRDLRHWGNEY